MQAIILAAGMGKRLKELTNDNTKCMIRVNDMRLIERMLRQLEALGLDQIVLVVGYKGQQLIDFIETLNIKTPIRYVWNEIYDKTNNIYSLYLAKDYMLENDTLLIESDLIFEDAVLTDLLSAPYHSLALVAKYQSWMDGTVITIGDEDRITSFLGKKQFKYEDIKNYYKTVNIYKFSKEFSTTHYVPFLSAYVAALGENEYYEQVLKVIINLEKPDIKALILGESRRWYEIDDIQDLDIASSIFAQDRSSKYDKIMKRYGGYWRYPGLLDYCYLVNPLYPPMKMLDEIKASLVDLATQYPSGQRVNNLLASKYFGIKQDKIIVGNGAAELISILMKGIEGNIGVTYPTFEEYPNRSGDKVIGFLPRKKDFRYSADDLTDYFNDKDLAALVVINPDNPTGNYINRDDVCRMSLWAKKGLMLIVDESFIDFADAEEDCSLLNDEILESYNNLVVVKSISKSFGVPGFRLGIAATANERIMKLLSSNVNIWNINSFGEFFMQIFEKYQSDYKEAIKKFFRLREELLNGLAELPYIRILPTQANFVMCEVTGGIKSRDLAEELLDKYNIFIKDLSGKKNINGQYVRFSIRNRNDNALLLAALKDIKRS